MANTPNRADSARVTLPDQAVPELGSASHDPVSRYLELERAFNAGQIPSEEYTAAFEALVQWEPATAHDFLRKFVALFDNTFGEGDPLDTLARQGRRLLGEA